MWSFFWRMYRFFGVSIDFSIGVASSISSGLLQTVCGTLLDRIFVVLPVFLLPIKSTVPPAVFEMIFLKQFYVCL